MDDEKPIKGFRFSPRVAKIVAAMRAHEDSILMKMVDASREYTEWYFRVCRNLGVKMTIEEFDLTVALVADELACQKLVAAKEIYKVTMTGTNWHDVNRRKFWRERQVGEMFSRMGMQKKKKAT